MKPEDVIGDHVKWLLEGTGNRVWGTIEDVNAPYLTVRLKSQPVFPIGEDFDDMKYTKDARHKPGDLHFVHIKDVLDHALRS